MSKEERGQSVPERGELARITAQAATEALVTVSADSSILFANPAVKRVFGYEPAELEGKPYSLLVAKGVRESCEQHFARLLESGPVGEAGECVDTVGLHRDGRELSLELNVGEATVAGQRVFTAAVRELNRDGSGSKPERRDDRYRMLIQSVEDYAIFLLDPEGCVISWNDGAERIKGYSPEEIIGKHFSLFYPEEDRENGKPERSLEIARREGRFDDVGRRIRKGGEPFLAQVSINALYDEQGRLRGYGKATRDITSWDEAQQERTRLLDRLRREREQLEEIFRLAPAFMATLRGPEHRFETVNERYLELVRRESTELLGKSVRDALPELQGQGFLELLDRVYRTGEPYMGSEVVADLGVQGEDGGRRTYVNFVYLPLRDERGQVSGIFVHGVDVTAQTAARKEVEEAGTRLAALADASRILTSSLDYQATLTNLGDSVVSYLADWCTILIRDSDGVVRRVSAAHNDPAKAQPIRSLLGEPHPSPDRQQALFDVLRTGEPQLYSQVDEGVLPYVTNNPRMIEVLTELGCGSFLIVPLVARQEITGALFLGRGEARKPFDSRDLELALELARRAAMAVDNARLYERAQVANEDLEERVRQRTKDLESFSYSVSHDLRAPLRGIDGFAQALLEDFGDQLDEVGRGYIDRVRNGARRMGELIDDLLNLSQVSRETMARESVDLSGMARETLSILRGREPERQVEVLVEPDLEVFADERLITVLMENLLENAWKFTRQAAEARIEVGSIETGRGTAYYVRDNGAGFDAEYAERIFEPFQRLHDASEFEGTGIGLATVQRIVVRHGGSIWAKSKPGRGTAVYFTLGAE